MGNVFGGGFRGRGSGCVARRIPAGSGRRRIWFCARRSFCFGGLFAGLRRNARRRLRGSGGRGLDATAKDFGQRDDGNYDYQPNGNGDDVARQDDRLFRRSRAVPLRADRRDGRKREGRRHRFSCGRRRGNRRHQRRNQGLDGGRRLGSLRNWRERSSPYLRSNRRCKRRRGRRSLHFCGRNCWNGRQRHRNRRRALHSRGGPGIQAGLDVGNRPAMPRFTL